MNHVKFDSNQKEFWDFDWEQMGIYDQPAFINYILNHTNQTKLAGYVGHSEGTTQFFAGQTLMPNYFKSRVEIFIALAPAVRMNNVTPILQFIAPYVD